ncbi:MAG: GHKL domain-containing protein [Lachnospiraceae bacterium]|nr:GHKL domain-containing protein [Lachnospiraceae bacterium]
MDLVNSIADLFPGFPLAIPSRILAVFIYLLYLYLVTRNAPSTDAPLCMDYLIGCSSVCLINIAVFYLSPLNGSSGGDVNYSSLQVLVVGGFLLSEAVMLHMVHLLISQNENHLSQVIWHNQREESAVIVNYNAALEDEYQKLQHEIRHTASLASLLIQRGEYVEAQKVLSELQQNVDNKREVHTSSSIVDTILEEYRQKASVMNVLFTADVHLTDELPVSPIDLCSMLSNMLSNALEASVNSPEPFVSIEIYPVKSYLMIRVKNRVSTDVLKDNPNLHTTKHNPATHGKGTRVMRQICEKYNGMLSFEVDNLVFNAEALLLI